MKVTRTIADFADLLDRPAPVSDRFVPMDRLSRAAQFASYKALNGFEDMVDESARPTESRVIEPDEEGLWDINQRLRYLSGRVAQHPEITVLWFRQDEKKAGGSTQQLTGRVKRIDTLNRRLILLDENGVSDGDSVALRDITRLDGPIFRDLIW